MAATPIVIASLLELDPAARHRLVADAFGPLAGREPLVYRWAQFTVTTM
jgi:hypothetical protein